MDPTVEFRVLSQIRLGVVSASSLAIGSVLALCAFQTGCAHAQDRPPKATSLKVPAPKRCVDKIGQAVGITQGFAEYEAFLIIRQVTGNWPVQVDRISQPTYACKPDGLMWTCTARAKVCSG
jgi:hypothetical protein